MNQIPASPSNKPRTARGSVQPTGLAWLPAPQPLARAGHVQGTLNSSRSHDALNSAIPYTQFSRYRSHAPPLLP